MLNLLRSVYFQFHATAMILITALLVGHSEMAAGLFFTYSFAEFILVRFVVHPLFRLYSALGNPSTEDRKWVLSSLHDTRMILTELLWFGFLVAVIDYRLYVAFPVIALLYYFTSIRQGLIVSYDNGFFTPQLELRRLWFSRLALLLNLLAMACAFYFDASYIAILFCGYALVKHAFLAFYISAQPFIALLHTLLLALFLIIEAYFFFAALALLVLLFNWKKFWYPVLALFTNRSADLAFAKHMVNYKS